MPAINVKGMSCQHCVASVTKALTAIAGISNVKIDLATGKVTYDQTREVPAGEIKTAISAIGFEVIA
ncbi:MAG: mercury transporter [Deltaproteobacteria bacterium RIFOXYD12_FULL_57_12]|nr:MAG: mercury transporter [Deltaproteobacteria bacterium RIFOXYD12_FULL_57_12]